MANADQLSSPIRKEGDMGQIPHPFVIVGSGDRWRVVELSQDRLPGMPASDWMTHSEALLELDHRLQGVPLG